MKNKTLLLALVVLSPGALRADHQDFVVVNATASKDYTRQKFAKEIPKPESYVFFQGKFFGGGTRDPSMERASFSDIAKVLAANLARQNYFPTKDSKAADLLIVVNWGMTTTEPGAGKSDTEWQFQLADLYTAVGTYNADLAADGGAADPREITFNLMVQRGNQLSSQTYAGANARLLGYTDALKKEDRMSWASLSGVDATEQAHLADLIEERYFVVILAYDYQKILRAHNAGGTTGANASAQSSPRPLWSVRMNMGANGNNFTQALPAMSQVAADYFGKQLDDLQTLQASVGTRTRVEIGETRVLNSVK